ncbi:uncharacterized protein L201_005277 [Kwoniella dendrophila CBS 6074]|uniref:HIT-type domain-containing protein n=1 Tax=Kwoniella dendrophila CBS 6074 TaxID=1295534 RepID=A0AAX4JYS3_9TREE
MPLAVRKQPSRNTIPQSSHSKPSASTYTANNTSAAALSRRDDALNDFQNRRLARRLDDLERTNPTDIPATSFIPGSTTTNLNSPIGKKKQSSNVRKILYGKKSLKDWLDELPPEPSIPYLTSTSPIPLTPSRRICSSCGYLGSYKCQRCAEWSCDRTCLEIHERDGGCGIGG